MPPVEPSTDASAGLSSSEVQAPGAAAHNNVAPKANDAARLSRWLGTTGGESCEKSRLAAQKGQARSATLTWRWQAGHGTS
jgi:hypothetical protein